MKFNNNTQMRDELINSLEHSEKKNQRLTKFINYVADLLSSTPNDEYHMSDAIDSIETEICNLDKILYIQTT